MKGGMLPRVKAHSKELFQHKEGTLKVIGVYGRIIPVLSLVLMEKVLEENFGKKKVDDLLYLVGEAQSYNATLWTIQKVGIPVKGNELRIFNETSSHSELTGYGIHKPIKFDMKNKFIMISFRNSIFSQQYLKLFGVQKEPVDHYLRGLLGGIAKFFFNEEVVVSCDECISMGKKRTIYKAFPRKGCVEKYGESVRKFIPDASLKIKTLQKLDVKKLVM